MDLIIGVPAGTVLEKVLVKQDLSKACSTIDNKINIEKDKVVYLAALKLTNEKAISCIVTEDGSLPEGLDEVEQAFLYKTLWTDEDNIEIE